MESADVAAIILAKDEELAIGACIDSVRPFVREVVVVDSNSTDDTAEVARRHGARVVQFVWNGMYPKKKEWSLRYAGVGADWVILLDADERVTDELAASLVQLTADSTDVVAYDLPIHYFWRRKPLRYGQQVRKRSLIRASRVAFPEVPDLGAPGITEVEGHYQPVAHGKVSTLDVGLIHDDPDPLSDWYSRHNRYSDWEAHLRTHGGAQRVIRGHRSPQGRMLDSIPFKALAVFVYGYLVRQGWRDGRVGFEYAMSLAFYQFQIGVKVREVLDRGVER